MHSEGRKSGGHWVLLGLVTAFYGQTALAIPVTSVTTSTTTEPGITLTGNTGNGNSGFLPSRTYNLQYDGQVELLTSVTAGGETYVPLTDQVARVELRRSDSSNNATVVWQLGTGTKNDKTLHLTATPKDDVDAIFSLPSLTYGIDNVFANSQDYNDNYANIERIDFIFDRGLVVTDSLAFVIFDRGVSDAHDGFQIAGISSLSNGLPSNYGQLLSYESGTWGQTSLTGPQSTVVLRQSSPGSAFSPTVVLDQDIGGVVVKASSLAPIGTTIYGYSLFAPDVVGSGTDLVDWTNTAVFLPTTTGLTEDRLGGGLDLTSASALLYTSQVPEPATMCAMATLAGLTLLRRRRA